MPPSGVPILNVADDTFIVGDPRVVARLVNDPIRHQLWWPQLSLNVSRDRGRVGVEWTVNGVWAGQSWAGSMEMWLEPVLDGVVLHHYVRLDPVGRSLTDKQVAALNVTYATDWKRHVFALKDAVESTRSVGAES